MGRFTFPCSWRQPTKEPADVRTERRATDEALVDVLTGAAPARGRLPFDLPSSTAAVEDSRSDVPFDTADPLFRFGNGLQD